MTIFSGHSHRLTSPTATGPCGGRAGYQPRPMRLRSAAHASRDRGGVILLVVLGMLTLFSVLGVSYLVYSNNQRAAAVAINRAERSTFDPQPWLDDALERLVVGAEGPQSSLWGHDLLGDLYGIRDGILGRMPTSAQFVVFEPIVEPDVLLGEFVRIPSLLYDNPDPANPTATYPNRRNDTATERQYPFTNLPEFKTDDDLAGRILTFVEGPLANLSMKIVRSFGDHLGAANGREVLTGQLVLDLRPHLDRVVDVEIGGVVESRPLREWLDRHAAGTFHVSLLFYDQRAQFPIGGTNLATPLSQFYINGRMLNGPGLGWDRVRDSALTATAGSQMNLNEVVATTYNPLAPTPPPGQLISGGAFAGGGGVDLPVGLQGHYATYRRAPALGAATPADAYISDLPAGDTDEPYDAPDDQNWWLSYFPIDDPGYVGPPQLGTHPIPSFVRPGTLSWLINQEGRVLDDPNNPVPLPRLQQILLAIRRATLRPLPIINDPWMPRNPSTGETDLTDLAGRADGVLQLDYSRFTGGNSSALGTAIDFNGVTPDQVRELVRALAGLDPAGNRRPDAWDVDNDGDGVRDGVWIDAGLELAEDDNGRLIKPLVSYLVEDLGGRVDVNLAGNLAQARNVIQKTASGVLYRFGVPPVPIPETVTHNELPAGFGYGPAEIDMRPLFAAAVPGGPLELLARRLKQQNVSGTDYVSAGHFFDPLTGDGNDFVGLMRQPGLANLHSAANAQGLPVDKFGRGSLALGIDGGLMVAGAMVPVGGAGLTAGDSLDDPYEMDLSPGRYPDQSFTLTDLEAVLRFNDFDRDALESELVALANNYFTAGTIDQVNAAQNAFADSVTTISNSVADATGILPQEFRDPGSSGTDSHDSLSPQALLTRFTTSGLNAEQRNAALMQLLPQSLLAGGKIDLNRPFGNGIDDDGDGVVDDAEELRSAVEVLYQDASGNPTFYSTRDADFTNGQPGPNGVPPLPLAPAPSPFVPTPEMETPQSLFARHLYVLAMAVLRDTRTPAEFDWLGGQTIAPNLTQTTLKIDGTTANTEAEEYRAWRLAQWAINVADFRDPDGIMSRFDYDVDPFDGWHIAAFGTSTTFRTVWGMEYPELALEESLAFHDRRVRDTDKDASGHRRRVNFMDPTPDQYRLPQGSLFLELRSTRSPDFLRMPANESDTVAQAHGVPSELYDQVDVGGGTMEYMLNLAKTAPDRNPVWRIAITRAHQAPNTLGAGPAPAPGPAELSGDEVLQPVGSAETPFLNSAPAQVAANRATATLQPERPSFFGATIPNAIDRVIWFGDQPPDDGRPLGSYPGDGTAGDGIVDFAPNDSRNIERIFYNRFRPGDYPYQNATPPPNYDPAEVYLRGGQYAVIGPRTFTPVGSLQDAAGIGPTTDPTGTPLVDYDDFESPQRFELYPNRLEHFSFTNTSTLPTVAPAANATIRQAVGVLAAADPPTGWSGPRIIGDPVSGTLEAIGLNVSEPLPYPAPGGLNRYYDTPTAQLDPAQDFPLDSWHDYPAGTGFLPNDPFDGQPYAELAKIFGPIGQETGTRERFKTAYLQRLADPTQAYDPNLNPYLSVDYITIDLTVFNGSDSNAEVTHSMVTEWVDPADQNPFTSAPEERFGSRYKTGRTLSTDKNAGVTENLSHSVNTFPPQPTALLPPGDPRLAGHQPFFAIPISLDATVDPDNGGAVNNTAVRTLHSTSLGYANASYGQRWNSGAAGGAVRYAGTPINNWFTTIGWLNRPFVSKGELMWVPTTSPGTFAANFGTATVETGFTAGQDLYQGAAPPSQVGPRFIYSLTFPHLWNYFSQHEDHTQSPNIHRLLEWVEVPAPFDFEVDFVSTNPDLINTPNVSGIGQSTWGPNLDYPSLGPAGTVTGHPDSWTNLATPTPAIYQAWLNRLTVEPLRPPLNIRQPQFRQGRINLNTIKSPAVYRALMSGVSQSGEVNGAFFDEFIASRRGYAAGMPGPEALSPLFNNTQPSQLAGAFRSASVSDVASLPETRAITAAGEALPLGKTIMRPGGVLWDSSAGALGFSNEPLFSRPLAGGGGTALDEFVPRSAPHQQLPITRLSNLATDQSNVFAVWITVGLFEVDATTMSVGNEVGADTGESRRYRSFHIIDRSVPVMYEPGKLNNALETVLLSRPLN